MLKYCLIENPMATDTKNFIALVYSSKTIVLDDFINDMVDEGTGLTRPQALAYFEKLSQLTMRYIKNGYNISTPLFRFRTSITGLFNDKQDTFDANRHQIKVSSTAGARIRGITSIDALVKVKVAKHKPEIYQFVDCVTDKCNSIATAGDIGMIQGIHLRFDKTDAKQGVFFVSTTTPKEEYRASSFSGMKPSEMYFKIPALQPGEYYVVIRSMDQDGKELLMGKLDKIITV